MRHYRGIEEPGQAGREAEMTDYTYWDTTTGPYPTHDHVCVIYADGPEPVGSEVRAGRPVFVWDAAQVRQWNAQRPGRGRHGPR
jgi:hypothetical protein